MDPIASAVNRVTHGRVLRTLPAETQRAAVQEALRVALDDYDISAKEVTALSLVRGQVSSRLAGPIDRAMGFHHAPTFANVKGALALAGSDKTRLRGAVNVAERWFAKHSSAAYARALLAVLPPDDKTAPLAARSALARLALDARTRGGAVPHSQLFASTTPIDLTLRTDFDHLLTADYATPAQPGRLTVDGCELSVIVHARGSSSLRDLPRPKLRIEVESADGSLFANDPVVVIGVKGGDSGNSRMGRVLSDAAPMRESAAYQVLRAIGVVVPQTRVANIRYVDSVTGTIRQEKAFLIEKNDHMAERIGGIRIDEEQTSPIFALIRKEEVLRCLLGELLVGNGDFVIHAGGGNAQMVGIIGNTQNAEVIYRDKAASELSINDFDLSDWVRRGYVDIPDQDEVERFTCALGKILGTSPSGKRVVRDILAREKSVLRTLAEQPLDDRSRAYLTNSVQAFFAALHAYASLDVGCA